MTSLLLHIDIRTGDAAWGSVTVSLTYPLTKLPMGKSIAKVVYKPDPNASDVFIVIVNHAEVRISTRATEGSAHTALVY